MTKPLDEIPPIALQSEGGQQLTVDQGSAEGLPATEEEKVALEYQDAFSVWFELFNTGAAEGAEHLAEGRQHLPTPGYVSWAAAAVTVGEVADTLPGAPPTAEVEYEILQLCRCRTRHIHAPPTRLPGDWLVNTNYVMDRERFCGRPRSYSDAAQNWFAVEVYEGDLVQACASYFREVTEAAGAEQVGQGVTHPRLHQSAEASTPRRDVQLEKVGEKDWRVRYGGLAVLGGGVAAALPWLPPVLAGLPALSVFLLLVGGGLLTLAMIEMSYRGE